MSKIVVVCPSCDGFLRAVCVDCELCGTKLEGQFKTPSLLQLPHDDLTFVVEFLRSSGSLKAMAAKGGTSYPTVRSRLTRIIGRLDSPADGTCEHGSVLEAVAGGRLSARDAEEKIRRAATTRAITGRPERDTRTSRQAG
jgi:hypothetical protein